MIWSKLRSHLLWALVLVGTVIVWQWQAWQSRKDAEQWGVDKERLRVADSTIIAMRADSIRHTERMGRLVVDSALLADAAVELRADFAREYARWQRLLAGWQEQAGRVDTVLVTPGDSLPSLDDVIRQANATIASCRSVLANCEARAANAEQRVVGLDSLWRNAESRASQYQLQARTWQRIARPSLWEQLKQIPGRALTTSAIVGATWLACKAGS